MYSKEYTWLPYLENSMTESVRGYTSGMYSITLEAWRRGLSVKFIKSKRSKPATIYEISNGEKKHRFISSRGDLITSEALAICRDKAQAKYFLRKSNVPTPEGTNFDSNSTNEEIIINANNFNYPLVIKPVDGSQGKGVIANIKSQDELKSALIYVREDLGYKSILLEEYFEGEDYRVYVVGDKVVGIIKRIPANIIGDGKSTIKELVEKKNDERRSNPILNSSLIRVDNELINVLTDQGLNLNSTPAKKSFISLKTKNNISAGGDPVDITDDVPEDIKKVAINALKAIPGLPHGGVDLMVNREKNTAIVLELNTQASIRTHLFPMKGIARNVPKKLIDYYFPDTKSRTNIPLYYDFGPIWSELKSGATNEITLPDLPKGDLILTRFIINGNLQRLAYGVWVRRKARELNISGFVRHLKNGSVSVVVCGESKNIEKFRTILKNEYPKNVSVTRITEKERKTPVPIGFVIKNPEKDRVIQDGYFPQRLKDNKKKRKVKKLQIKKRNIKKTKDQKKREVKQDLKEINYHKEYKKVLNSTSWKITKPIRVLGKFFKK